MGEKISEAMAEFVPLAPGLESWQQALMPSPSLRSQVLANQAAISIIVALELILCSSVKALLIHT